MSQNRLLVSCLIVVLGALPANAQFGLPERAQQKPTGPTVSTRGRGEVKVVPDMAELTFDVDIRGTNLKETRDQMASRMGKLLGVLRAAGIKDTEMQTTQVILRPHYKHEFQGRFETKDIDFYSFSQSVSCTIYNLSKVAKVTEDAIEAGATEVGRVNLGSSKMRQHEDQARLLAVRAAKEKAKIFAEELGVKVGKPQTIVESREYEMFQFDAQGSMFSQTAPPPDRDSSPLVFEGGSIKITADVSVLFGLE